MNELAKPTLETDHQENIEANHWQETLEKLPSFEEKMATEKYDPKPQPQEQPQTTSLEIIRPTVAENPQEKLKPVDEMTTSEIVREYLDLLHDLSENFTNPESAASAALFEDGTVRSKGYSGDSTFVKNLYQKSKLDLESDNPDLERAHTLKVVDKILSGEQAWQAAGTRRKQAQDNLVAATKKLEDLRTEQQNKGFFGKLSSAISYRKQVKAAQAAINQAQAELSRTERISKKSNEIIQEGLNYAYSPDYYNGHHRLNSEHEQDEAYQEQTNAEYNDLFFGDDHQEKVARALELRKALIPTEETFSPVDRAALSLNQTDL